MKSYLIRFIRLIYILCTLGVIFPTFGFDYKFTPETILMVTHFYGYTKNQQMQRVKTLINETLINDGKVIINFDREMAPDFDFRNDLIKNYINFYSKKKLIFINSKVGEFIDDEYPKLNTGLPIIELQKDFNLNQKSAVYVIGNFFGACHRNTLFNVLDLMYRTGLKDSAPIIHIDLNLVTGRTHLSAHKIVNDSENGLLAAYIPKPYDIIVIKTNKRGKVTKAATKDTEEVNYT